MTTELIIAVINDDIDTLSRLLDQSSKGCEESNINFQDHIYGNTALHYAVKKDNFKMVEMLLLYGAERNIKNFKGILPMDEYADPKMMSYIGMILGARPFLRLFLRRNRR
jgi:ankyrin repeat protein